MSISNGTMDQDIQLTEEASRSAEAFAASELFERTFHIGMDLVKEAAAYLDGPGRDQSRLLDRAAALAYAGESMRLTTRLMQVSAWLLIYRSVREGEMPADIIASEKYRLGGKKLHSAPPLEGSQGLPDALQDLITRCEQLYGRVARIEDSLLNATESRPAPQPVHQLDQLRRVFEGGPKLVN